MCNNVTLHGWQHKTLGSPLRGTFKQWLSGKDVVWVSEWVFMCWSILFQFNPVNIFWADTLYQHSTDNFYMDLHDTLWGRHEDHSLTDKGTDIRSGQ